MIPLTTRFCMLSIALLLSTPILGSTPDADPHSEHAGCPLAAAQAAGELPEQIGQDAFSALAEMRSLLIADPTTDWSQVDLDALRNHLVDMNRVMLDAEVSVQQVPGGFQARVIGTGRTLEAIRRMIPAHTRFINGREGLQATASTFADAERSKEGVVVTVTAEASAVDRVRGLGFFGFLVAGDHHRPHHRAMAMGNGHP